MTKLLLKRIFLGETYTIGKLYIDNEYFCDTIEDKVRDIEKEGKVYGETAIPYGTYKVILSMSPRFKRVMPEILNVPHFSGIRIHRGNTAKDTLGCIIVGENKVKGKVINSTVTEKRLMTRLEGCDEMEITIQ